MKISVIGTGYVGLVSGTCFAEIGHQVTCIDIDPTKVERLSRGIPTIYESGLKELLERNIENKRLDFSTNYTSVQNAQAIFLAVGTPSLDNGSANLEYLFSALGSVLEAASEEAVIVIKSTVPVGTAKKVKDFCLQKSSKKIHIVNNPEFLKEGAAINDFMRPDRIVLGADSEYAFKLMQKIYAPLVRQGNPILEMSNTSAELTKYASNCFLATKISFINEMARLCDDLGADIEEVRRGMGTDARIGKHFLYPGPGYGGSCFPKDIRALMYTAKEAGRPLKIVSSVEEVNKEQKSYLLEKVLKYFKGDLSGKTFAFWGVAFKANTDDVRESPAIDMAKAILEYGGAIQFYDPEASDNFLSLIEHEALSKSETSYHALKGADALIVLTEWREFQSPNFDLIKERLKYPVIFDGRNLFQTQEVLNQGFDYYAIGKRIHS